MKRLQTLLLVYLVVQASVLLAQPKKEDPCKQCNKYLYWTGEVDQDFFNEHNWREATQKPAPPKPPKGPHGKPGGAKPQCLPGANKEDYQICLNDPDLKKDKRPAPGTLDPGKKIKCNLYAKGATIVANGIITFESNRIGFTLDSVQFNVDSTFEKGVLSIDGASTLRFTHANALGANAIINLLDTQSWVYFLKDNPDELLSIATQFWVNDAVGTVDQNLRLNQYYQQGALLRKKDLGYTPLVIYSGTSGSSSSADLYEAITYTGNSIPAGLNNQTQSFILKRGYMATFAIQDNGTGKSKVYIASEEDLRVDVLPAALQGNISFIRVLPWNWVNKKGTGGLITGLDAAWFYNWGNAENSKPNDEYVPMIWGAGAALPPTLNQVIQKEKVTHLLGFNESDNCNDQSGQFNNLCQPEVAVAYYENLMRTGLRLGTPAPRENGPTTWLKEFARLAKERDVRFDFVAVHWYDWGSAPQNSPNADPQQVFNRFKAYLANVYQIYGLPIWITEFNANPNRENSVHAAFLELALPYLEQLDYVERYAFFQPEARYSSNIVTPSNYYDSTGTITNIGIIYRDHSSSPSVPEASLAAPNNLEGMDQPYVEESADLLAFEAECGLYKGTRWEIKTDSLASNQNYIQANLAAAGATDLAQQTHFEFETEQNETLRLWVRLSTTPNTNGSLKIRMDNGDFATLAGMSSANYTWFRIPRFYTLSKGKHRLSIAYVNGGTKLDKIVLSNSSAAVDLAPAAGDTACTFAPGAWGLIDDPKMYWLEAETPTQTGAAWETGTDQTAIGGQFLQAPADLTALDTPPGTDGQVSYTFQVDQDDEFNIWGKIQAFSSNSDAFWFSVDHEPFRKWDGLKNEAFQWKWNKFYFSEGSVNRPFTYFLAAGSHTITLAYAKAESKLDRLAIASTSLYPAQVDADVLRPDPVLDFEAENAVLLGTATVVACAKSSNGQQVNIGISTNNGVRFDNVAVPAAGAYRLTISYMTAVARNCRLRVNNVDLGIMAMSKSGEWCFNNGAPADYKRSIQLNAGVNQIEIRAIGTDAPFIDKIALSREMLSFEAELAELTGTVTTTPCDKSSNGAFANLGAAGANSVRFNGIELAVAGTFQLDVAYFSKVQRDARIFVNGTLFQTASFEASGNWCFENGTPKVKSFEIPLMQGMNNIEIKPTGADAPFIDKIAILQKPLAPQNLTVEPEWVQINLESEPKTNNQVSLLVYPNPVNDQAELNILMTTPEAGHFGVQLIDILGRVVYRNAAGLANQPLQVNQVLNPGIYFIVVDFESKRHVQQLVVK